MRQRHGNKAVLEKIVKDFEFDWDRTFSPSREDHEPEDGPFIDKTYFCGLFKPDGDPHLSPVAITLGLFRIAAKHHFDDWDKADKFVRNHLYDIIWFAENPTDSLFDSITRKFEKGCKEPYTPRHREERIRNFAGIIYACVLRWSRPWYRHPKWHVHHWKLQVPFFQRVHRLLFERCHVCGKGFGWNESPITDWNHTRIWHQRCDTCVPVKNCEPNSVAT
jgi:hypothetical protein